MLRKFAKMIVAGANLNPGIRDAYERLLEILIAKAGGAKHGARTSTVCTICQSAAARLERRIAHYFVPSMAINCRHPEFGALARTWGHHPGLDDGPESFQETFIRPPSSARGSPYVEGNNPDHGAV